MDRETVIALAEKAGLSIHEGTQDRLLFDVPIVDALAKFADLAKGEEMTIRVSFDGASGVEVRVTGEFASPVIDAIKAAFEQGQECAKAQMVSMLTPAP